MDEREYVLAIGASVFPDILCSFCHRVFLARDFYMHMVHVHALYVGSQCVWCLSYVCRGGPFKFRDNIHRLQCLALRRLHTQYSLLAWRNYGIWLKKEENILDRSLALRQLEIIVECSEQTIREQATLLAEKEEELHRKDLAVRRLQTILMEYLTK